MTVRFVCASIVVLAATLDRASAAQEPRALVQQAAPAIAECTPWTPAVVDLLKIAGPEYDIATGDDGAVEARTPQLGLSSRFDAHAVQVANDAHEPVLRLSLEAWGRGDVLAAPLAAEPHAFGKRVEYRRGPITEWYVNGRRGLQQGFTVDVPPAHALDATQGELELVLSLGDQLDAVVLSGGRDAQLVDCEGQTVLCYSGLLAWDSKDVALDARLVERDGRLAIQVEDANACYPLTIDPWIASELAVLSRGFVAQAQEAFGTSVDISDEVMVVGVPGRTSNGGSVNAGGIDIYHGYGSNWVLAASWNYYDEPNARWGEEVAVDGDQIVVAAPYADGGAPDCGVVLPLRWDGSAWVQDGYLVANAGVFSNHHFGGHLDVSGDTAVIGSEFGQEIWRRTSGVWAFEADLFLDGDCAVSGNTVASEDTFQNSVRIYVRSGTTWSLQAALGAPGLGLQLALDGDQLAASGPENSGCLLQTFSRSGTTWTYGPTQFVPTSGQPSSTRLDLRGDLLGLLPVGAVGFPVSVFKRSGGTWTNVKSFNSEPLSDFKGSSLALWGDTFVTGVASATVNSQPNAGKVFVHRANQASCPQHFNYLKASTGFDVPLHGQDGWVSTVVPGSNLICVRLTFGNDGSPLAYGQSFSVGPYQASRLGDSASPFPVFNGSEKDAYVQADLRCTFNTLSARCGIGYDRNNSGHITPADTNEMGPALEFGASGTQATFGVIPALGSPSVVAPAGYFNTDWTRLRLVMDLTANAGAGAGSLYALNLTAGQRKFTPVAGLQNINLGLSTSGTTARNPDNWEAMFMRFETGSGLVDNFVLGKSASKYDFECLPSSDTTPFEPLLEGAWVATPESTSTITGVAESGGFDGSACLRFEAGSLPSCSQSLVDGPWSVPVYAGNESATYFQFDARVNLLGVRFGVAADINNSKHVTFADTSERGVEVVLGADSLVGVALRDATGVETASPLDAAAGAVDGDWVRVRVVMDLAANSGAGSASVYAMNLTAGDLAFSQVAGLQDIPLALDQSSVSARDPRRWNAVFSRFSGGDGRLDNLEFAHDGGTPSWSYCTAGVTTNGCQAHMWSTGTPSLSATSGFVLRCSNIEADKSGLIFYGINGPNATNWNGTSVLCAKAPFQRLGAQTTGGFPTTCDGVMATDWSAYVASHPVALGVPFSAGQTVNAQAWFRDPPATKTTNLSDGLAFVLVP